MVPVVCDAAATGRLRKESSGGAPVSLTGGVTVDVANRAWVFGIISIMSGSVAAGSCDCRTLNSVFCKRKGS